MVIAQVYSSWSSKRDAASFVVVDCKDIRFWMGMMSAYERGTELGQAVKCASVRERTIARPELLPGSSYRC